MSRFGWLVLLSLYVYHIGAVFWRLPCPNRSGTGRLDPLVSPDGPSKHVHAIFGGNSKLLSPLQGNYSLEPRLWIPHIVCEPDLVHLHKLLGSPG